MSRPLARALYFGAALAAFASGAARANDDGVVTITARLPEKETASSVTVVTADDIARTQAPSVFEALRGAPGISLSQNGGAGQTATVRLRGASSDQTLVLIDGIPVNDPSSPSGYNFAYLDSSVVERIEVLRGAGSAIWGSDALGGVINIVTFAPGETGARAYAEGGSLSTGRLGARLSYAAGPLTLTGYGAAFTTGGVSSADRRFGNSEDDGAQNESLAGRAVLALGNGFSAEIGARTTQGDADFDDAPSHLGAGLADSSAIAHSREGMTDARLAWRSDSGRFGGEASVSHNLTKTDSLSPNPFNDFATRGARTLERITADGELAPGQRLLVGGEHSELRAEDSFDPANASRANAGFASYDGRLLGKLLLEGGVRYENDSRFGAVTTGRIGAALDVWRGGRVRATIGNAFKAPTIAQRDGDGVFVIPNPDLKPEKSDEWEIGGEQRLLGGAAQVAIVYFDREVRDLIAFAGSQYANLPRADSKGVEVSATATLQRLDLAAVYTHDRATDETSDVQLLRTPKDQVSFDASWRASRALTLGANVIWNGAENDFAFDGFTFVSTPAVNPAWTRLDLRAAYSVSENIELYGRIENAADAHYESVYGFGAPGRAAYFGLRVKT